MLCAPRRHLVVRLPLPALLLLLASLLFAAGVAWGARCLQVSCGCEEAKSGVGGGPEMTIDDEPMTLTPFFTNNILNPKTPHTQALG
jgi:hypothetical protein